MDRSFSGLESPKKAPCRVRGIVTRHEPYGFYVDFGAESDGLVTITMTGDDREPAGAFSAVGSVVEAVLLGYTEIGGQPRLSLRAEDFDNTEPYSEL